MEKASILRVITKLYFIGALTGSFIHLVHAGFKGGLGNEAYAIPFMIDGIAIMGMVMRSGDFATHTNRFGFKVQLFAGSLSLAGNIYAASNIAGAIFGASLVGLYVFAELMLDHIETRASENARKAAIEAEAKKQAAIEKGKRTRAANKRKASQVVKEAERIIK